MNKITIKNFRCFREKQEARLAPLTLLVGENSTGKTSFMALIRALWDVAFNQRVPDFKEEPYDLGSFDEIAHHRGARGSRADSFEAGFDFTSTLIDKGKVKPESKTDAVGFYVTFTKGRIAPIVTRRKITQGAMWIEDHLDEGLFRFCIGSREEVREIKYPSRYVIHDLERDRLEPLRFIFKYFMSEGEATEQEMRALSRLASDVERGNILRFAHRLYAGAPVRFKPYRTYNPARPTPDSEGGYIPMYLANMHFKGGKRWEYLKEVLEKFGKEAGLFDEISVRALGKEEADPFQLQIKIFSGRSKGPSRNLVDVGYGVSQVLPVITELLRRDAPSIRAAPSMFLLQQPEVHLHPKAQATLGSLFCKVAGPRRQLVVETHSDHLLDRVRMDIRDGESRLKPEDVSILFFERGNLDVQIHSLQLNDEGQIIDAPESYRKFFMEEVNRRLKL